MWEFARSNLRKLHLVKNFRTLILNVFGMTPRKISRKNFNNNRNGIGLCEAPLRFNFTTAMVRISTQRDKQDNLCNFSTKFSV